MSFELIDTKEQQADIKVVGVGGCGNNAIEYMIKNKFCSFVIFLPLKIK